MFTFEQIPLGKVWTHLSSQLWVKLYHYCSSRRMDLALNNLKRVDMTLNKETKPILKNSDNFTSEFESYRMLHSYGLVWYYIFTTPSWLLVSWLPHVSTGLSLFLSTPTLLSDPRKEKMDVVQSMKVGIRVGEKKSCQANLKNDENSVCYKQ